MKISIRAYKNLLLWFLKFSTTWNGKQVACYSVFMKVLGTYLTILIILITF